MKLQYFVLNYDFNHKKVVHFNIFDNIRVKEDAERLTKEYLERKDAFEYNSFIDDDVYKGKEGYIKALDSAIQHELWCRREYEISVGDAFEEDINKLEKWDAYKQAHANIELIAELCIKFYSEV